VRVEKEYLFDTPESKKSLSDLFAGMSQLIVYHFMFAPEWEAGCKHCSFWADNLNGIDAHLKHRDVTFIAISRAPLAKLQAFKKRMGWSFNWFSSGNTDFNYDFKVSYPPAELGKEGEWNFKAKKLKATSLESALSTRMQPARSFTPIRLISAESRRLTALTTCST
jgi:predicted dithiol-disulfide oxidoreductase (DUF899 family)